MVRSDAISRRYFRLIVFLLAANIFISITRKTNWMGLRFGNAFALHWLHTACNNSVCSQQHRNVCSVIGCCRTREYENTNRTKCHGGMGRKPNGEAKMRKRNEGMQRLEIVESVWRAQNGAQTFCARLWTNGNNTINHRDDGGMAILHGNQYRYWAMVMAISFDLVHGKGKFCVRSGEHHVRYFEIYRFRNEWECEKRKTQWNGEKTEQSNARAKTKWTGGAKQYLCVLPARESHGRNPKTR